MALQRTRLAAEPPTVRPRVAGLVWWAFVLKAGGVIIGGLAFRKVVEIEFSQFRGMTPTAARTE